ncbi:MAG: glycosyltransferase family 2 protein [Deltaproteobacteria bacterium]|nr:glycosyltransferase family 2 protein [Deltaproteobacteria bacterium]
MESRMKKISIVVPVYNEEENIQTLYDRVDKISKLLIDTYEFEFIFTDNHSEDNSFFILKQLSEIDPRIKIIRFSRNFGYQRSIITGYSFASGEAAIQLDCDLQDPPELLIEFLTLWEQGYQVVYGIRKERKEGWIINTTRKIFYRLIDRISADKLPHDAGDFRLIDRCIIDELKKIRDASPYIRGLIASLGFKQIGISYSREARKAGKSKFNLSHLFQLAIDGIVSHSVIPLRMATYLGFLITIGALLLTLVFIYGRFYGSGNWPRGFATTTVLILFGIGLNGLFLGIIGEYLGRIYLQIKIRPLVIIEKTINIR